MNYRVLGKSGIRVSEIGVGRHLSSSPSRDALVIRAACGYHYGDRCWLRHVVGAAHRRLFDG